MGMAAFNRRRTLTAATTAAPEPQNPQAIAETCAALALINSATGAEALLPLPTVGKGASKAIYQARPEGGYSALSELPQAIFEPPYNCKLAALEGWEG